MRLLLFIGLLLILVTGLALGCGETTNTTSVSATTVTAAPTTTATASGGAIGMTTTTHDRLTDPTYPNVTTTEPTWTTLDVASAALVEPYTPFIRAVVSRLAEMLSKEDPDIPFEIDKFNGNTVYDDKAQAVVLEISMFFGDYVKFRDVYDERAWQITQAVAAVYIDDECIDLLEGNPPPSWRLSLDGITYEVPATVMTGIAQNEVTKDEWLRATGR